MSTRQRTILFILILLGIIVFYFMLSRKEKEPKGLLVKFVFGKTDSDSTELVSPSGLTTNGDFLYSIVDSNVNRIQVLKINPDGGLSPKFSFGKPGKNLGEFGGDSAYLTMLAIKDNFLFVADTGNSRIQALEIKY